MPLFLYCLQSILGVRVALPISIIMLRIRMDAREAQNETMRQTIKTYRKAKKGEK